MRYKDADSIGGKTRFVFESPPWWVSALVLLLSSAVIGFMLGGNEMVEDMLLLVALPAYLTAILSVLYAKAAGEVYWARTDLLISMATFAMSAISFLVGWSILIVSGKTSDVPELIVISLSIPVWIRHVYMSAITVPGQKKALPFTLFYPVSLGIGLWLLGVGLTGDLMSIFISTTAVSIFFSSIFLAMMDAPMERLLGVGGLEFTMWTVEHYKEKSRKGHDRLEEIFDRFGEPARIYFSTISFMKKDRLDSAIVVHTAHPGPVGDVGGGELPSKLSRILGIERLLSPHGPSTHSLNPTTEKEVEKLGKSIFSVMPGKEGMASVPVRTKAGNVSVLAQRIGGLLMIVETSHPRGTEDIDPAIALALRERVRRMGYSDLAFIDAHNSFGAGSDESMIYSPKFGEIEEAVEKAAEILKDAELHAIKSGFGISRTAGMDEGVAGMGVSALILETAGKRTGYVVIDGNNMVPELRPKILDALSKKLDYAEVMTTDNHYVNRVSGGKNPVGYHGSKEKVVRACVEAVDMALDNLSDSKAFISEGSTQIKVFGPNKAAYMYCVSRSIDGTGAMSAFLSLFGMVLMDILLAMLI